MIRWKRSILNNRDRNRGAAVGTWPERLNTAWDLFRRVVPADGSVLGVGDYGCGRQELRRLLPPGWSYTPYDHLLRSPDTVVCDFNDGPLPGARHDVIFCLGVLEHVRQPGCLLAHALRQGRWVVFSNFEGWNPWRAWREGWRGRLTRQERERIFAEQRVVVRAYRPWRKDGGIWVCQGGQRGE